MKNVNLTGIYLDLITKCGINGFELSSIIKTDNPNPCDMVMRFTPTLEVKHDDIKDIVNKHITSDVKHLSVAIKENKVEIYMEFIGHDFNDTYAY